MSTIFISHSSKDNEIAVDVARRLAQQNHQSVFLDLDPEKGIVAGQSWERTLYRKLRACRAVIAVCTDNYLSSQWCFAEVALARMEGKHIIALKAAPLDASARMPAILNDRQFIDLRVDVEEGFRRLWRGLKEEDILGVAGDWNPNTCPYLGLSAFGEEHAPVFFGRETETRQGLELLERGAPGLIMVLGASGSGKSSLVRAGIVPRLRREPERWLVLDPIRPGNDPFTELSQSLESAYRRFAATHSLPRNEIRKTLLGASARRASGSLSRVSAQFGLDLSALESGDERIGRLIEQLEALRTSPPAYASERLRVLLDESLADLKHIVGQSEQQHGPDEEAAPAALPLVELVETLRRSTEDRSRARVLLVVDQFEELLGHGEPDHPANRFLGLLRRSVEASGSPLTVLGTMRSDFLDSFQRNTALIGIDFESLSVGVMGIDGMRQVIERPALLGALELEDGLADRLLADTETSDALPLLSFTLWRLWRDFRQDGKLDIRDYESLGGLHGALAGEADAILEHAKREGRVASLRAAMVQLARVSEDGAYARRLVPWDDPLLVPVHDLLERFVERRLLVVRMEGDVRSVEVTHEALFRSWTPLKTWLENHRAELLLVAQLRRDASAWLESGRDSDALWRGGRLQQAHELSQRGRLQTDEREFVRAGVLRRQRQRWLLAGITGAVMAGLAGAAVFSYRQKLTADDERARAMDIARVAVAAQWIQRDPNISALVLGEVQRPERTPFVAQRSREVLNAGLSLVLSGHESQVFSARFSPEGDRVVTASGDGTARIFWIADGRSVLLDPYPEDVARDVRIVSAEFNRDGSKVVTASADGTARVWNYSSDTPAISLLGHELPVLSATFSPDGEWVLTTSEDDTARLWPAGGFAAPLVLSGHESFVVDGAFSPDGTLIATASHDGTSRLWDLEGISLAILRGHAAEVMDVAFRPDGRTILTASMDATARLWNLDGTTARVFRGHDGPVVSAVFNADGSRVVTASRDHTARIWNVDDPDDSIDPIVLSGHADTVMAASFSPDGARVVTSSTDGTAKVWDAGDGTLLFSFPWHTGTVVHAEFSPDGERVVTASTDGTARVWSALGKSDPRITARLATSVDVGAVSGDGQLIAVTAGDEIRVIPADAPGEGWMLGRHPRVIKLSFSPDATVLGSTDDNGRVRLWDVPSRGESQPDWLPSRTAAVAYSRDGGTVLVVASSGDVQARSPVSRDSLILGSHDDVTAAGFAPDERRAATASYDGSIRLWNVEQGDTLWSGTVGEPIIDVRFAESGDALLVRTQGNVAHVLDARTGHHRLTLSGHTGPLSSADFDQNSVRIITASRDGTARIWSSDDAAEPIVLMDDEEPLVAAWFSADGDRAYTLSADGTVRQWTTISTTGLRNALRTSTNECLTAEFRQQFLGESPADAVAAAAECSGHRDEVRGPS